MEYIITNIIVANIIMMVIYYLWLATTASKKEFSISQYIKVNMLNSGISVVAMSVFWYNYGFLAMIVSGTIAAIIMHVVMFGFKKLIGEEKYFDIFTFKFE